MARTNSFTIKASLTTLLVLISFFCFYISYSDFVKINNEYAYIYEDVDINYFDKKKFQKYYDVISIESLDDPIFDKEKSKNYFENITLENLSNIFDKDLTKKEDKIELKITDDSIPIENKIDEKLNDNFKEEIVSIKIVNPISSDLNVLRNSLYPNLIFYMEKNSKRGFDDQSLFEIGPVFTGKKPGEQITVVCGLKRQSGSDKQH